MQIPYQKIRTDAKPPERATDGAVGYDVYANRVLDKVTKEAVGNLPHTLRPGESVLIGIGVKIAVPFPYQVEVRPRSGLASLHDIELSNSPGTIDPDFRGEAGVLLRNRGGKDFVVEKNMRVAQLVIIEARIPVFEEADELPATRRDSGGFGSTGLMEIEGGTEESLARQLKLDRYFMKIAVGAAGLSECVRGLKEFGQPTRQFGCVIVKEGTIISQGYNSFYPGQKQCSPRECIRERESIASGTRIEVGGCVHAEWMAITRLGRVGIGVPATGSTMYVNAAPCITCAVLITLVHPEAVVIPPKVYDNNGLEILRRAGIIVRQVSLDD